MKKIVENSKQYALPVQLFYFFVLVDALTVSVSKLNNLAIYPTDLENLPDLLMFLSNFDVKTLAIGLTLASVVFPLMTFMKYNSQALRILNVLTFILAKGVLFSLSRYSHQYWPMLWSLIFLAVPKDWTDQNGDTKVRYRAYEGALLSVLLFYFFPGFWKLIEGVRSVEIFNLNYGSNMIAAFQALSGKKSLLSDFFIHRPVLAYVGMILVLVGQLLAPLFFFRKEYLNIYLIYILFFHTLNIFILHINFLFSAIVALILIMFMPSEIKATKSRVPTDEI